VGGPIAFVKDGDIDHARRRRAPHGRRPPISTRAARLEGAAPRYKTGVMAKYAASGVVAAIGAVTSPIGG
jgi:dihydroxyacid dehydratase/phosphogluconate dehydratase